MFEQPAPEGPLLPHDVTICECFARDGYDLILTSFPHFVSRIKEAGVASEYFRLGFDPRMLSQEAGHA